MRSLLFTLIALTTFPAFAQSRVVGDTFASGREAHQQDTEKLRQQWLTDYAGGEGDRTTKRETIDQQRQAQRDNTEKAAAGWFQDWNDADGARQSALSAEDAARVGHQSVIAARPDAWWSADSFNK